ncbi:1,4-alpha-glucan branching enzyme GlgB [Legionella busanensis]|uniref:1,4-alpha-glucan branching enzyme GlgB n=1 Tax=Legionella busanensis TaxID=190655 RepID=A0A378JQH0_9GAMM|nr:1,4-alpha-glucan branching protein GlgB [Legionella busanensis]STX50372.1 1,4-alpha-glucan branching enzyme GlgB [Legionella busanensis]
MDKTNNDSSQKALLDLARDAGILLSYEDAWKKKVTATPEVIICLLNRLGIPIEKIEQAPEFLKKSIEKKVAEKIDKNIVFWDGKAKEIPIFLTQDEVKAQLVYVITCEDGSLIKESIDLDKIKSKRKQTHGVKYIEKLIRIPALPIGYHHLKITLLSKKYTSLLIAAPTKFYTQNIVKEPCYGVFAPIYALHDEFTNKCGDLSTFAHFSRWLAEQDTKIVATMPFFASFSESHCEPSPYSPVSRLFWNDLYLNLNHIVNDIEEDKQCEIDEILNDQSLVNYPVAAKTKRQLFTKHIESFLADTELQEALQVYREKCPLIEQYSLFRAKNEVDNQTWHAWTAKDKKGKLKLNADLEKYYYYHLLAQWQFDKQLKSFKEELNQRGQLLYLDLPVGVHKDGFDTWYFQDSFLEGISIGAPPDPVFKHGQNWGSPPLSPETLKNTHFNYFILMLRNIFQYVDILRIDHVMGFNRLFWIPDNFPIAEGVYVQYPAEEMYAILSIESNRYKASIIGENLGCVPPITDEMMQQHDMIQMNITQYLLESKLPLEPLNELMLTSLNTHDMPTFFAFCQGLDIEKDKEENNLPLKAYHDAIQTRKKQILRLRKTLTKHQLDEDNLLESSIKFLAASKAKIFIINIEDLWQETKSQNIPASGPDKPNWRRKFAYSIEQIKTMSSVNHLLHMIRKLRPARAKIAKKPKQFSLISKDDLYLFNEGTHYQLYDHLGAHYIAKKGIKGVYFAVWAPNAHYVSVVGSFNFWHRGENPMSTVDDSGIWEVFIPNANPGDLYKFYIESKYHHYWAEKADPFAFLQEVPPNTASIVWHSNYQWHDETWMNKRGEHQRLNAPISIYEVHLGSWRRVPEEGGRFLNYRELAPLLAEYVLKMNFTHVELLPIMEHPFYGSWGYQTLGYFAPTARYGSPDDFKYLVDYLHQHNIGVILDWVPSHFPNDEHGLAYFDGTHLFEHSDPRKGFHPDWKSAIFNYGRHEVKSFLISSALYWLEQYHIDGLRVDAVASMLYLNYSRSEGEWIPNVHGGNENLEAIDFLQNLNKTIYHYFPDVQTFAEESTAWPGVSRPTYIGGLGFGFKWDMGWMHDTLSYLHLDPIHRRFHQHRLSFRMIYAFNENFTLSLSHDESVHGKGSLYSKMSGDEWQRFANLRLLFGYMFGLPGKKLLFMGNEFGQRSEWNHEVSIDWHVLDWPLHQGLQAWVAHLNKLYKEERALHDFDHESAGFEWIDCEDAHNSIYSFLRKSAKSELILIVLNCTPVTRFFYRIGVPKQGKWKLIASSDATQYGGSGNQDNLLDTEKHPFHYRDYSISLTLPGISVSFYKWIEK